MHPRDSFRAARRGLLLAAIFASVGPVASHALDLTEAISRIRAAAEEEVDSGRLTGVSVAWVEDQAILFAAGFGRSDKARGTPASEQTVYRVGSISKLLTALAAMQLAESGRLDIDAPVSRYVPEFGVVDPFADAAPPTLRQLMCHRSGLVREAPVGGYFDGSEPSAESTVASLADTVLVHPPGTRTKYSNSGVTVVGRAVESASGIPFTQYQSERVLGPVGMRDSAFALTRALKPRLARGYLPFARPEGGFEERVSPQFEFGILAAGNLYSTVGDLGRFLSCLFANGRAAGGQVLRPETLAEMWRVQAPGESDGFGLGFAMGRYRGHRTFGHAGEVYGFTSRLIGLPEHRLGVVVLANDDIASGPVQRLTTQSLDLLLEARLGLAPPAPDPGPAAIAPESLAACHGDYESESYWARIDAGDGGVLKAIISRQAFEFIPVTRREFRANGRRADRAVVTFEDGADGSVAGFHFLGQRFARVQTGAAEVPEVPEAWEGLVGSYGPAFIPLIVSVRHGHLYAMTENLYDYRLRPVNRTVFAMPPGLYESEHLVFERDRAGRVHGVLLADMPLPRRR